MSNNGKAKSERVHVLALKARNIKSVREVAIDLKGEIHEIRGDAGQGKTTILQAIKGALAGLDSDMIRLDEDACEIELRLSDAQIKRIIPREGKDTILVTGEDGKPIERATEFLRTIYSSTTFNPIEWVQLSAREGKGKTEARRQQRDMLLQAIPMPLSAQEVAKAVKVKLGADHAHALGEVNLDDVDFEAHGLTVCGAIEKACYEFRKSQNTLAEDAENRLSATPPPDRPAPKKAVETLQERAEKAVEAYHDARARSSSRSSLAERAESLRAKIAEEDDALPDETKLKQTHETYRKTCAEATARIEELEQKLAEEREKLAEAAQKVRKCEDLQRRIEDQAARRLDLEQLEQELAQDAPANLDALREAMEEARADLAAREAQDRHDAAAAEAAGARERAELYTALVKLFRDDLPKTLLGRAELPVDGLGVDGDSILINGVPIHQLGTSEQIKVGVLIASALNPRSGFVLVDGAESLGQADRAALAEAARDLDLQLIMTFVDAAAAPAEHVTVMRGGEAVKGVA